MGLVEEIGDSNWPIINLTFPKVSHVESNHSVWDEAPTDLDYMSVDDLQKLTDEFVTEANASLTPKPLWRPFVESLFKDIDTLDLNGKDKVLIADLEYLKDIAFFFAESEEKELGELG